MRRFLDADAVAVAAFFTLCGLRITAVGQAFFGPVPNRSRLGSYWPVATCHRLPTCRNTSTQYPVPQGGKSPGKSHHPHPFLSTYKRAFTTSISGYLPRRRTTNSGSNCCQSLADKSERYRFRAAFLLACSIKQI